ncbi:MAG: type II toxin-antitoxin system Phd/YefM family antitoxin [Candidatus Binatia bacterium]
MKSVPVRELKNRLSTYLRDVRAGEVVLITDRGNVVAELRRPTIELALGPVERALQGLRACGVEVTGLEQSAAVYRPSPLTRSVASADLLEEERGDR